MSILAPGTQPSQAAVSSIADTLDDSWENLIFPSQEEIELELAEEAPKSSSKRKHADAFPSEVNSEMKFQRANTWNRIDSLEETEALVAVNDRTYEYDPELRPYRAVVYNNRYHISIDTRKESNRVFRTIPANRFLILVLPPIGSYREAYNLLSTEITYTFPDTGEVKRWTFLGSSDSRLRDRSKKSVIFFEEGPDYSAREVLQHFGDLDSVLLKSGMGKYFARLGLNFSTTTATITVPRQHVAIIPDIPAADGKEFTDGCGCITANAAKEVAHQLGLSYVPSVLQFRFAGAKGVLVPHENKDLERWFPGHYGPDIVLYLRPSQVKYEAWQYLTLDISDYSKRRQTFRCAKLQRAMIRILTDLGVPLRNFKVLLHKELERLTCLMDDRQKASEWLQLKEASLNIVDTSPQTICLRMIAAGHDLTEPRLCEMVGRLLAADVAQLRRKFNIAVPKSIYLFGVCDESGQLSEDEIHCHAGVDGFIEGRVIITRSPMMHPGDIRLVTAVKPKEDNPYRLHSDMVVLPMRGYQPLADKMGGGDLDGDMYFVSWNDLIIPPAVDPPNPRFTASADTSHHDSVRNKKMPSDHMDSIMRHIAKRVNNYDIGETAKKWEEFSNARALGSRDPYCLALAQRYECCLDTNKTGEEIPPFPDRAILGPLATGSPPTKELDDIIVRETYHLAFPWTWGQGDRTSFQQKERFVFDHDLLFFEKSPEWKHTYAQMVRVTADYWSKFHKTIKEVEGPNRPLVRVERDYDVGGKYERVPSAKDLVREAAFQRLDDYTEQLKLQIFPKSRRGAEYNKENTIAASACLALVYNRMSVGLATPIDFGWWGEPWLNSWKAQRVSERSGAVGPPVCVAQGSKQEAFTMELRVKEVRRTRTKAISAKPIELDNENQKDDEEPLFMDSDEEAD